MEHLTSRQKKILATAREVGTVEVDNLSTRFSVSLQTTLFLPRLFGY